MADLNRENRLRQVITVNRWLFLAVILGMVAVYLSLRFVAQVSHRAVVGHSNVATVPVVVAVGPIGAFVPLVPQDVVVKQFPQNLAPPNALSSLSSLSGAWTTASVAPGMPIGQSAVFFPKTSDVLASRIAPGDLAVDLPLGSANAVDGLVVPGDRITLFTTIPGTGTASSVEDFMNNIPVLGVNGLLTPSTTSTIGQGLTLILALPASRIPGLLYAEQQGKLVAALDPPHSTAPIPAPYTTQMYLKPVP